MILHDYIPISSIEMPSFFISQTRGSSSTKLPGVNGTGSIVDPKGQRRLRRVAKACKDFGQRVQFPCLSVTLILLNGRFYAKN